MACLSERERTSVTPEASRGRSRCDCGLQRGAEEAGTVYQAGRIDASFGTAAMFIPSGLTWAADRQGNRF